MKKINYLIGCLFVFLSATYFAHNMYLKRETAKRNIFYPELSKPLLKSSNSKILGRYKAHSKSIFNLRGKNFSSKQNTPSLDFPKDFTLLIQGILPLNNGDLLGGGDCVDSRFLIHAPHNGNLHVMIGSPQFNSVTYNLTPNELGKPFSLIISKKSDGTFMVGLNGYLKLRRVAPEFEKEFKMKLQIGNSPCGFKFDGRIDHLSIDDISLDEEELSALLEKMNTEKFQKCKSANLTDCI